METEIGEYVVGAYLKLIRNVDFVDYNVRPPGGGLEGLGEMDVVGLDFKNRTAYLCEVTTHILGLRYGNYEETVQRIIEKHKRQKAYAKQMLEYFNTCHFMFWSPIVPKGKLLVQLEQIDGLDVIVNDRYTSCFNDIRKRARDLSYDLGNPVFRLLQIMERLK